MNLFDMLKADKGIPVSDPMARLWGYQYQQKHGVSEISGVPPLHFTSRGGHLLDYRIYGNIVQDGTPTPENPVEVQGCGERTENLFDYNYIFSGDYERESEYFKYYKYVVKPNTKITFISNCPANKNPRGILEPTFLFGTKNIMSSESDSIEPDIPKTITSNNDGSIYIALRIKNTTSISTVTKSQFENGIYWANLIEGTTSPTSYIPYGYEIPVMVSDGRNAVTTPVYIGSEPLYLNEYVSYGEQQIYKNINGALTPIEPPVPIPAITTARGENILTTETTVQPSNIWIKGKIKAIN